MGTQSKNLQSVEQYNRNMWEICFCCVVVGYEERRGNLGQDIEYFFFSYSSDRAMCLTGICLCNLIKSWNFSPELSGRGMCLPHVVKVTPAAFAGPLSALSSIL